VVGFSFFFLKYYYWGVNNIVLLEKSWHFKGTPV
jgi:hypothetical protein